jgi:hypothetical protein
MVALLKELEERASPELVPFDIVSSSLIFSVSPDSKAIPDNDVVSRRLTRRRETCPQPGTWTAKIRFRMQDDV